MPERTRHPHATISWTDLETTDHEGAKGFYAGLFGWEYEDMEAGDDAIYSLAKLNGRSAAALSAQRAEHAEQGIPPHWNLYVTVEDVDAAAGKVGEAGGQVLAEPFDVFDAGRMAVIADSTGGVFCLWQAGTNIGAEVVNEPGTMSWADVATSDAPATQAFYAALLGWRFEAMSEEPPYWVIFNGERSQGGMTRPPADVPPNWFPYFAVADVEAAMAAARGAGAEPFMGPVEVPNTGTFGLIRDPQGATFAVFAGDFDD